MRAMRIAAGCLLLVLGPGAVRADAGREAPPLREWIRGPIRYIATSYEIKDFRRLRTDDERALFIERFWNRRDPTPQTLTNEYRQMFWERVQEANATLTDSTRPGWMTDRGKIYILYGPPTERQEDIHLRNRANPAAGRGVLRWIYEGRPGGRIDVDPVTVVAFYKDATGEYRLSHDPVLSSIFFESALYEGNRFNAWAETFTPRRSELGVMLDMGKLQEVPPQEQVLIERVGTIESYQTRPLRAHLSRHLHPGEDGRMVVVTVDLSDFGERTEPALMARFTSREATARPRIIGEGSFRIETVGEQRLAQGKITLPAGTYDLLVLAANPVDATTGLHRGVVALAQEDGSLGVSDVVLARALEPLPYRSLVSHEEPFLLGPYRVVPRLAARVPRGEAVDVFFEVYGGGPPYRVRYALEGLDENGRWVALGRPQEIEHAQSAQAWGVTTGAAWPLGEYRVRIEVDDATGSAVSTTVGFVLVDSEAG